MVPLFDAGTRYGRAQSTVIVYNHNNRDIMLKRSTDLGVSWGAAKNITLTARPAGSSEMILLTYTGPGGGIQLESTGRLLVPMIATFTTDPNCNVIYNISCFNHFSRDLVLISDDGGVHWRPGKQASPIHGCNGGKQCGDEFQVAALGNGTVSASPPLATERSVPPRLWKRNGHCPPALGNGTVSASPSIFFPQSMLLVIELSRFLPPVGC
jgi:hypothetical protein